MCEPWGQFFYVRDLQTGLFWSAGHQPVCRPADAYEVVFSADKALFRRRDGDIETLLEIAVSPEQLAEVRRITLTNHGNHPRELELTSYAGDRPPRSRCRPGSSGVWKALSGNRVGRRFGFPALPAPSTSAQEQPIWAVHVDGRRSLGPGLHRVGTCNSRPIEPGFWGEGARRPTQRRWVRTPCFREPPVRFSTRFSACGEDFGSARRIGRHRLHPGTGGISRRRPGPGRHSTTEPAPWPGPSSWPGHTVRSSTGIATGRRKTPPLPAAGVAPALCRPPRCGPLAGHRRQSPGPGWLWLLWRRGRSADHSGPDRRSGRAFAGTTTTGRPRIPPTEGTGIRPCLPCSGTSQATREICVEQLTNLVREAGCGDAGSIGRAVFSCSQGGAHRGRDVLLEAASRGLLDGARGSLSGQLDRIEWARSHPGPLVPDAAARPLERRAGASAAGPSIR